MSRSYKKHPVTKDTSGSAYRKWAKRQAAKRVRRSVSVPDGKSYRKFYDPWNISDYIIRYDPWPRMWFNYIKNQWEILHPDPEWKARMK
jgi:hypothetical protein